MTQATTKKANMKNRIKVEIEKTTAKAFLITAAGRKAWIQKRWLGADETVSESTFSRQADEFESRAKFVKEIRDNARDFKNSLHKVAIERETEKAIACKADFEDGSCTIDGQRLAWFPKSQVKNENKVPGWLILAKARELAENIIGGQNHFSITVNEIGGVEVNENVTPSAW